MVAVLAGVAFSVVRARGELLRAEEALLSAREAARDVRLEEAGAALDRAERLLDTALGRLRRPHVRLAALIPVAGHSLRTATDLAASGAEVASAARTVTDTLLELRDRLVDGEEDGRGATRIPVDGVSRLVEPVNGLAAALGQAEDRVAAAPDSWLHPSVADAQRRFLSLVSPLVETAQRTADLVSHLPEFLGAEGPRRYFFGVANPAEQRGTGGYIGAYSLLTLDGGTLTFGSFREITDLTDPDPDEVELLDPSLAHRYGRYGWPWDWQSVNLTPDFPSTAAAVEQLWRVTTGRRLDGAIVADPYAFETLLELQGPVSVPGITELTPENVVTYVTNTAFAEIEDNSRRKQVLGEVATRTLERFLGSLGQGDVRSAAQALTGMVRRRHLLVHSTDPATQEALAALDLDGGLSAPEGDFLATVVNSGTGNKLDFYTQRRLRYRVRLRGDGVAEGELELTFRHDAPTEGLPSRIIGTDYGELEAGENRSLVSVFCAQDCAMDRVPAARDGLPAHEVAVELGHTVHSLWLDLPSGTTETLRYRWQTPGAWRSESGRLVYELTIRVQTTILPTPVAVEVAVPDGFRVTDRPPGSTLESGVVHWRVDDAREDLRLRLVMAPAGGEG